MKKVINVLCLFLMVLVCISCQKEDTAKPKGNCKLKKMITTNFIVEYIYENDLIKRWNSYYNGAMTSYRLFEYVDGKVSKIDIFAKATGASEFFKQGYTLYDYSTANKIKVKHYGFGNGSYTLISVDWNLDANGKITNVFSGTLNEYWKILYDYDAKGNVKKETRYVKNINKPETLDYVSSYEHNEELNYQGDFYKVAMPSYIIPFEPPFMNKNNIKRAFFPSGTVDYTYEYDEDGKLIKIKSTNNGENGNSTLEYECQ